jgi:predicted dehydrogenase
MLLAKSCHDLDWIRHIMDSPCERVSSFGGLFHFHQGNAPEESAERCLDCRIEPECPYSAKKVYLQRIEKGHTGWPVSVLANEPTKDGILEALENGPYGRCVYRSDNDVVDHQVVNLQFAGGQTAAFTMAAFTALGPRRTRIFGTRGEIEGDGHRIKLYRFSIDQWETLEPQEIPDVMRGHGGGDFGLMRDFISSLRNDTEPSCSPREILESHRIAFAAERSRIEGRTITMEIP